MTFGESLRNAAHISLTQISLSPNTRSMAKAKGDCMRVSLGVCSLNIALIALPGWSVGVTPMPYWSRTGLTKSKY